MLRAMNAVEFTAEMSGSATLTIPPEIVSQLPSTDTVRVIVLTVEEADETEYLLSSPMNREKLLQAVEDVEIGRNMVEPDQTLFQ